MKPTNQFESLKAAQKLMMDALGEAIKDDCWIDLVTGGCVMIQIIVNDDGKVTINKLTHEEVAKDWDED